MIRKSYIIPREKIFGIMMDNRISKVEIASSYNKNLSDKSLCKIYVYFKIDIKQHNDIMNMIKSCMRISYTIDYSTSTEDMRSIKSYLASLCGVLTCGFIKESQYKEIVRIKNILKNHKFNAPKYIGKLLNIKAEELGKL